MAEYTIEPWRHTHEFLVNDGKGNYVAHVKLWKGDDGDFHYEIYQKNELEHSSYEGSAKEAMFEIAEWVGELREPNLVVHPDLEIMEKIENG